MKKHLLFYFVVLLSFQFTIAQDYHPFPMENSAWNTVGNNSLTGNDWQFRYAVYGDTLINNVLYSKVYEMYDSTILNPASTYFAAIRENDNKQVFCLIPGFDECMLYDFGLEVDEQITFPIGGALCYDGIEFWEQTHTKTVGSISTFQIENGEVRKKWHFEEFLQDQWVEGIGSIKWYGLFNPLISDLTLCGDSYQFACFKQNDTTLFLDNPNCNHCFCDNINGIENFPITPDHFTITPNPASSQSTIEFELPELQNLKVTICDITGHIVLSKTFGKTEKHQIKLNDLPGGIYYAIAGHQSFASPINQKLVIR